MLLIVDHTTDSGSIQAPRTVRLAVPKKSRIYWRSRGGSRRAYADFRAVGGKREPLIAPGDKLATTDRDVAAKLYADRLGVLEGARRGHALGVPSGAGITLAEMAATDLAVREESKRYSDSHLGILTERIRVVLELLDETKRLTAVTVADVRTLISALRRRSNRRGGTLSDTSIRHHLSALSGLYRRAQEEGALPPGFNPVSALREKPAGRQQEAKWLEVPDAARFLEAARTYVAPEEGTPFAHALIATFLLTGARETEVYGLQLDDVSFDRQTVTIRPNIWRRLKTRGSERVVPLWPQLAEILRAYLMGPHRPTGELLFPSVTTGREAMLTDVRKLLNHVAVRAGFLTVLLDDQGKALKKGGWPVYEGTPVRTKQFRHTYCAARLQTLDGGAQVSMYTVSRELGHSSIAMVQRVYSHVGTVRHRSEAVEYRAMRQSVVMPVP